MGVVLTREQIDYINKKDRKSFDYCFIISEELVTSAIKTGFLSIEDFKNSPYFVSHNIPVYYSGKKEIDWQLILPRVDEN